MNQNNYNIENEDAIEFVKKIPTHSIQLIICDPPFGIQEESFDRHYARDEKNVVDGYQTAPCSNDDYYKWACQWIHEFPRILKKDGSAYIISAWNHLCDIEQAIRDAPEPRLSVVNHIIWKYNFGVYTRNKFVNSHYHILRISIRKQTPLFFNLAYYDETEKDEEGRGLQYKDMEDVWFIKKEYSQGQNKNINKLPNALIEKIIRYSSRYGDLVCDLFLGNFTTAIVGLSLGRRVIGCEINPSIFQEQMPKVVSIQFPTETETPPIKQSKAPQKTGQRITSKERLDIQKRFKELQLKNAKKKDCIEVLQKEFERGYFSILNILKKE